MFDASSTDALGHDSGSEEPERILIPSPLGNLGIEAVSSTITGLVIVPARKERSQYTPLKDAKRSDFLDEALGRLSEYFAGARRNIDLDFDLGDVAADPFALRVYQEIAKIPYGSTRTYRKLASAAGRGSAYRAVRALLMTNPIPILIPCHRVVPQKSGVGTYIAGSRKKQWLLNLEQKGVQR